MISTGTIIGFSVSLAICLFLPITLAIIFHKKYKYSIKSFFVGTVLTAFVQSSSVTSSLLVPLAGVGVINLDVAFPFILGANVGTTITAFLASLVTGSPAAVTVALEHVLFNFTGSLIIYPMRKLPIGMSRYLADLSFKSKIYPFAYVTAVFFLLPLIVIFLFH